RPPPRPLPPFPYTTLFRSRRRCPYRFLVGSWLIGQLGQASFQGGHLGGVVRGGRRFLAAAQCRFRLVLGVAIAARSPPPARKRLDRKSTRLNSSHLVTSYA